MSTTLLGKAERLARIAHAGQYRRDKVTPYITHILRVVRRLQNLGFDDQHTLAAAWLHDTVEDGALIWQTLKDEGIPDAVISTVEALTKKLGERYPAYLIRVKANPRACNVKIADILDNLSDAPTRPQIVRYAKALIYLHES